MTQPRAELSFEVNMEDILKYVATAVLLLLFQACGLNVASAQGIVDPTPVFNWLAFLLEVARSAAEVAIQSGVVAVVVTGIFNLLGKFVPWLAPLRDLVIVFINKRLEQFAQARALRAVVAAEQQYQIGKKALHELVTAKKIKPEHFPIEKAKQVRHANAMDEILKSGVAKNKDDAHSLLENAVATMNGAKNG
jgi:hypothetical protein